MSLKLVVLLAFIGSISLTLLLLSCTLKFGSDPNPPTPSPDGSTPQPDVVEENNCWSLFVILFYVLAPIPILIARRVADEMSSVCFELATFITTGLVISSFALPIVLANRDVIEWGSCGLTIVANTVMFATVVGGFKYFGNDYEFGYSSFSL